MVGARDGGERRVVRSQESQPTEDMGIAAQGLVGADLSILSAEVSQKKFGTVPR